MNTANPYDTVAYRGYPFPQTHPARLATIGQLYGMSPVPMQSCRVLELGCGDGANLVPMAVALPQSEFIGIDLAAHPIAAGSAVIRALGLDNISLQEKNLLDVSTEFGQFDYIIAHGVYSWVPSQVRDKLLSICSVNLAPQGIAFVSYNTYPGGHLRQMIRQMMLFHVLSLSEPQERIDQARALLGFLAESQPTGDEYALFVKKELQFALSRTDEAIYHDDLAEINSPVYFWQFISSAAEHGLQYLSEAYLSETVVAASDALDLGLLKQQGLGVVAQEQYLDFLRCRKFRQTLLCHQPINIDRSLQPERLRGLLIASTARPVAERPEIVRSGVVEQFRVANGGVISIDLPLAKAALLHLGGIFPAPMDFDGLVLQARKTLGGLPTQDEAAAREEIAKLCEFLLASYASNMVELSFQRPPYMFTVSDRPTASPLARLQATRGTSLTSLRHTAIEVKDGLARRLVMSLDGTRDRATLLNELSEAIRTGDIHLERNDRAVTGEFSAFAISADDLEQKLQELARLALLIA